MTAKTDLAVEAWELYDEGNFQRILEDYAHTTDPNVHDLLILAELKSAGKSTRIHSSSGIFSPLVAGMRARASGMHSAAAEHFADWLARKDYCCESLVADFIDSAKKAAGYEMMYKILSRFLSANRYLATIAQPLFMSAFQTGHYRESLNIFETCREHINGNMSLQTAALCMIHLGRYRDAERFLVSLHKKISGTEYEMNYEKVRARYAPLIRKLPAMEKQKNPSREELMELGMTYLFNARYQDAVRIFESLSEKYANAPVRELIFSR